MSLTNRLLVYLLSLLAIVLVGFSLGSYWLVNHYLQVEADERLQTTMNTLIGSLDIEPDNVEWEPRDRNLSLPNGPLGEDICWLITDIDGHIVAQSAGGPELLKVAQVGGLSAAGQQATGSDAKASWDGKFESTRQLGGNDRIAELAISAIKRASGWSYQQRLIKAVELPSGDVHRPRTAEEIEKEEYPALVLMVGMSQAELARTGHYLLLGLGAVGLVLWLLCFIGGRWICRRALQPVRNMAAAAMAMGSRDLNQRLPPVPSGDELATMNRAFNQLLDRLEVSFEQQRRFTGDASHQLRTPLAIIQGQAEVALRRARSPAEYEAVLQTIGQQVVRLNELVEGLLFMARADAEAATPALQPFDLTAWLKDFEQTEKGNAIAERVRFRYSADRSMAVLGRPEMLKEIVKNLIDNAAKYSPVGSPILVGTVETDTLAGVFVEDRGSGIARDELERIFEPFFRSAAAQRSGAEGVGLGLSIANRLAKAMNGRIDIQSQPFEGSKFTVWLRKPEA